MLGVLNVLEKIMLDKLLSTPAPLSRLEKIAQLLCVLSVSLLVMGLVFLIYGTHTWLSAHYTQGIAAGITGSISLVLSAIIAGILYALIWYRQTHIRKARNKIAGIIKSSLSTVENELGDPIRENPKTALIIASFLGFLLEDKFFE